MASLGLPGLGNFVAEMLTLFGSFQANAVMTVLATMGLVASTVYSLRIVQRVFHGKKEKEWTIKDLGGREIGIMASMILVIIWLGVYPKPVLNTVDKVVKRISESVMPISVSNPQEVKNDIPQTSEPVEMRTIKE